MEYDDARADIFLAEDDALNFDEEPEKQ